MDSNKLANMLGIAQKAGKIISGEFAVEQAIRSKKACLVLLAGDASPNTKKKYNDLVAFYEVPLYEIFSKEEMGESIGKVHRAAIAVNDPGFSQALKKILSGE